MGNTKYWTDNEEKLVNDFVNDNEDKNRGSILIKLSPKIKKIIDIILYRYYGNNNIVNENLIKEECYNFILLKLITNFNKSKGNAYSYIGTIAKRKFYDILILKKNDTTNEKFSYIEDIDFYEPTNPIDDNEDINELRTKAIDKLLKDRFVFQKEINRDDSRTNIFHYRSMIDAIIEYLNGDVISFNGLFSFFDNKFKDDEWYKETTALYFLKKIGITDLLHATYFDYLGIYDKRKKGLMNDKYQEVFIYDDYTDIQQVVVSRNKLRKLFDIV